ncbi:MAG: recombinase family protein [Ruminococcus sp.]|nr:recombinase family protein [Ruminococcus sp.]
MPNVKVIPQKLKRKKATRVAAYTRVSSPKAEMIASLSAQVDYYNNLITANPDWELCGIYVDEAKTGTKDTRGNFRRLIDDCRQGLIDLVITKSVSRFARNTVDLLSVCRELREHGVDVYFENQDIHSVSSEGELMLTLLASIAQEQSRSDSENQKWRIRKNFEEGKPWNGTILGYRYVDGKFEIEPSEAKTVRKIFSLYLSGQGYEKIAKILTADGDLTRYGHKDWKFTDVKRILKNYTYTGNLILQTTYRDNHINKKTLKNTGQLPKFQVIEAHEPIIAVDDFCRVQEEVQRRSESQNRIVEPGNTYPFTSLITCEHCGKHYRRKTRSSGHFWICTTYNAKGKAACPSRQIPESALIESTEDIESITAITACDENTLLIKTADGSEYRRRWAERSRADSWTPEMKAKASEYGIIGRRIQCQGSYE